MGGGGGGSTVVHKALVLFTVVHQAYCCSVVTVNNKNSVQLLTFTFSTFGPATLLPCDSGKINKIGRVNGRGRPLDVLSLILSCALAAMSHVSKLEYIGDGPSRPATASRSFPHGHTRVIWFGYL